MIISKRWASKALYIVTPSGVWSPVGASSSDGWPFSVLVALNWTFVLHMLYRSDDAVDTVELGEERYLGVIIRTPRVSP